MKSLNHNNTSIKILAMKNVELVTKSLSRKSIFLSVILNWRSRSLLIRNSQIQNSPIVGKGVSLMNLVTLALPFLMLTNSLLSCTNQSTRPLTALAQSAQRVSGGVFIPRNGCYEGRIGRSHVFFDHDAGGAMSIVADEWPRFKTVAKLDMVFTVKTRSSESPVEVRQSFDKDPQVLFLEEGNDRIGLRVLFKLYGPDNIYHGHGMTETWLYPDGEMFVTAAAMFENTAAHEAVTQARLDIDIPKALRIGDPGDVDVAMDDAATPGRRLFLTSADPGAGVPGRLSLYWRTGRMEFDTYIFRNAFGGKGAPTYFRWPDYVRQAYGHNHTQPSAIAAYIDKVTPSDKGVQLSWPIDPKQPNPTAFFNTFFRLAMVADSNAAKALVAAEREPVKMTITGGVIHGYIPGIDKASNDKGYNDQEGCYEIRKTGVDPLIITLPADPLARTIRVKAIALSGHGAVTTTLDGKPLVPQLTTDGGIADDPLAPIHEEPEGPANAAMVTVKLNDKPQTLTVKEEDGIQLVYQARDPRRNLSIYSTKAGPRWSSLGFSLLDGHARNMRAYGQQNWALTENLLHWFAWMGYTPEQMLDQLRDFVVIKNGPDEIIFKYTSNNANDGARSEYLVSSRADAPAMQINVSATLTVLEQFPFKDVQFFDAFPFRGVEPQDWWYDNVLHMSSDGKWLTYKTDNQIYDGDLDIGKMVGTAFIGLYSSDRGNMLMLVKNLKPKLTTEHAICSNYVDLHMTVLLDDPHMQPIKISKGYQVNVEYELSIWGDKTLTRDQLIGIGKKSIKAGKLVLPPAK